MVKISEIKKEIVEVIHATQLEAALAGAYQAGFYPDGKITLVYIDGKTETTSFPVEEAQKIYDKGLENFYHIVSSVQSQRGIK